MTVWVINNLLPFAGHVRDRNPYFTVNSHITITSYLITVQLSGPLSGSRPDIHWFKIFISGSRPDIKNCFPGTSLVANTVHVHTVYRTPSLHSASLMFWTRIFCPSVHLHLPGCLAAVRLRPRKDRIEQAWMMYKMSDLFKKRRMDEAAQIDERTKRLPDRFGAVHFTSLQFSSVQFARPEPIPNPPALHQLLNWRSLATFSEHSLTFPSYWICCLGIQYSGRTDTISRIFCAAHENHFLNKEKKRNHIYIYILLHSFQAPKRSSQHPAPRSRSQAARGGRGQQVVRRQQERPAHPHD